MINVLVIVGTTTFDSLIKVLDRIEDNISYKFQVSSGTYNVKYHPYKHLEHQV